ncbi:hypothetical protein D3C81_1420680 [compost metagenome]
MGQFDETGLVDVIELPRLAALIAAFLGDADHAQAVLLVEFVDGDAVDALVRLQPLHVDEAGDFAARALGRGVLVAILDPDTGAEARRHRGANRLQLHLLGVLLGRRADEFAEDEGDDGQRHGQLEQREQRLARVQAGHAEDRVFRLAGQLREDVDRADQHRDRQHLVHPGGRFQHDVEERHQRGVAALHALQFIEQVEEHEQREHREQDEREHAIDQAAEIPLVDLEDPHAWLPLVSLRRRPKTARQPPRLRFCRYRNMPTAPRKAARWIGQIAIQNESVPERTQACARLIMLL